MATSWWPLSGVATVQLCTAEIYHLHTQPTVYSFCCSGDTCIKTLQILVYVKELPNVIQFLMTDFCLKIINNGKLAHRNLFQLFNIILTLFLEMKFWEWNLEAVMRKKHYSGMATKRGFTATKFTCYLPGIQACT